MPNRETRFKNPNKIQAKSQNAIQLKKSQSFQKKRGKTREDRRLQLVKAEMKQTSHEQSHC